MNPQVRQTLYYLGTIVPGVLGIALIWGGIDAGAANNIGLIVSGALNILGAGAPATAAVTISKQRKDGTLTGSPVESVVKGVEQVLAAHQAAQEEVEQVRQAIESAVTGAVPALGPLAQQVINSVVPQQAYSQLYDPNTHPWNRG
ncbi:holin [Mycobacterium phage EricB]|uniref:Holin n=1 Tax=Mycobacterium phage EricB TaxID=2922220 RepID=G1EBN6_9CAUD|nr:holin [Mycobacterium phage EricB]AEJ93310.1 holin [Mycobacterium phage EricB]UYL86937.1 holin [Mycobacterium phage BABullseye]